MTDDEKLYRFECACNGEIPIGDGPTLEETKRALLDYCQHADRPVSKALAELTAELMLSADDDPLHVHGVEFGEELNKALGVGNGS